MTTSINISSCFENPQSALISAFQRKNVEAFKYALERLQADPNAIDPKIEKSIFEKVLETPDKAEYINLCIDNGADLYLKNKYSRYPIHYAVDSLCPNNLRAFLKSYDLGKINVRYNHKNCLHVLIDMLPNDKYDDIAECIKILLAHGCNPNMPDQKSRTPFNMLLRAQPKQKNSSELVEFMLDNSAIDVYTYKADEMKRLFEKQNPDRPLPAKVEKIVDTDFMLNLLRARKEAEFESNFKLFKDNSARTQSVTANGDNESNNFAEDCAKFFYTAVQNNLENAVELLISEGVDVNKKPQDATKQRPVAFLASSSGFYRIVEMIMAAEPKPEVTFNKRNLLHEVCRQFGSDTTDNPSINFQKCFNVVLEHCDVNQKDEQGCTPLHYAVRCHNDDAVMALLEQSSYIGTKNSLNETPIDDINKDVLESYLDSCISTNTRRSGEDEHEVIVDYKFLIAPKSPKLIEDEFRPEIAPLQEIADNSDLRPLILHPVLSSFLYLKWNKLRPLFYFNLAVFSIFMVSLIIYIVLCQSIPAKERSESGVYNIFYIMSVISILILMVREIFQCVLSPRNYLKSPINLFEIVMIILAWIVLLQPNDDDLSGTSERILRAVTILFVAYEFLQLAGSLPMLSISTHMVILKKVAITFLKSIALYSIVLLAFAMSFYTLFGGQSAVDSVDEAGKPKDDSDTFNSFGYPGIAIIKTFVMLTGEFDASSLDLDRNGPSYCIIFMLFVFLVTIVLFNLLNALAVDDTHVIKSEGQLVDLCQRISVLNKYERIILARSGLWRWLKSLISIFPNTIPSGKIVIRPNKGNEILTLQPHSSSRDVSIKIEDGQEQELKTLNNNSSLEKIIPSRRVTEKLERYSSSMDSKIMKRIRSVLDDRKEKKAQEKREKELWTQIRSMDSQLKLLTDIIVKQKSS